MPSITSPTFLGLDVHKNTISAGILRPGEDVPDVEKISSDEESVRRLVARLGNPRQLRACYEAGPTGYELARLLGLLGVACQVIAPTLILTAPGDRVKTDKRDCRRLARLHRAGQLVAVRVPTVAEEAVRDLCRARADMVIDPARARHRLGKFLLRHGRVWRDGAAWTMKHQAWAQRFEDKALEATFAHYRATLDAREAAVETIEADLVAWFRRPPFAEAVARLGAYRGITHMGALHLASEVCDWRRFPSAGSFMGFTGLTSSEHSNGTSGQLGAPHLLHRPGWRLLGEVPLSPKTVPAKDGTAKDRHSRYHLALGAGLSQGEDPTMRRGAAAAELIPV